MSTLANKTITAFAKNIWFSKDMLYVLLTDGREVGIPLAWFPRLRNATKKQLDNWRLIGKGIGIHWNELDEDISVETMLA